MTNEKGPRGGGGTHKGRGAPDEDPRGARVEACPGQELRQTRDAFLGLRGPAPTFPRILPTSCPARLPWLRLGTPPGLSVCVCAGGGGGGGGGGIDRRRNGEATQHGLMVGSGDGLSR